MAEKWRERLITIFCALGLFFVISSFGSGKELFAKLFSVLSPALYGGLVALILSVFISGTSDIIKLFDKKNKINPLIKNILSIVVTILFIFFVFYLLIILIVPRFSEGIQNIIHTIENNWDKIVDFCNKIGLDSNKFKNIITEIDTASVIDFAGQNVKNLFRTLFSTVSSLTGVVFTAVISIVCCVYILLGQDKLAAQCAQVVSAYLPKRTAKGIISTSVLFWVTFKNFLLRQCIEAVILGGLLMIFMLIFKIPYALIIGTITAVLALIPYVGAFISCAFGAFFILLIEPQKVIVFLILFLVIQQIEGNIIYPHIVGKSVGLPAIWTLMAVYAGGELLGIIGMILFVPIVSVIYTLVKEDVTRRTAKPKEQLEEIKKDSV